jgi:hypothetical protein
MEYAPTSYNRSVYASPPVGGSGSGFARSIATLIPTQNLRHILSALVFATQSPYTGRQNVVNSRNVKRNTIQKNNNINIQFQYLGIYEIKICDTGF